MNYFSDSVFMSFADEPGAMRHAIASAAFLAHVILRGGYIFRGAITVGPVSHGDLTVW
jgi:hypothetical protein